MKIGKTYYSGQILVVQFVQQLKFNTIMNINIADR